MPISLGSKPFGILSSRQATTRVDEVFRRELNCATPASALRCPGTRSSEPGVKDPLISPEQVSPMVSVRKSRRTGAGRLVACQVSATQDCGQTPWAQLVDSERLGDVQKARIPRRAAWPGSPACTAPRDTNCGLSGRHATCSGLIRGSLKKCSKAFRKVDGLD